MSEAVCDFLVNSVSWKHKANSMNNRFFRQPNFIIMVVIILCPLYATMAQNTINYNSQPIPISNDGQFALPNYAMSRNPAMDQLFSNVRNHEGRVDWINAVGSPYLSEGFLPCKLYVGDEFAGDFFYRHNAYNDEIEIKDYFQDSVKQSLHTDKRFRLIDGSKEISLKTLYTEDEIYRNGYLTLIGKGERFSLYSRTKVKFIEGTQPVNSLVRPTPDKFSNYTDYYYSSAAKEEDVAYFLPDRKNKFISSFDSDVAPKLKSFIKENKINIKKETDLLLVIDYLNTL